MAYDIQLPMDMIHPVSEGNRMVERPYRIEMAITSLGLSNYENAKNQRRYCAYLEGFLAHLVDALSASKRSHPAPIKSQLIITEDEIYSTPCLWLESWFHR